MATSTINWCLYCCCKHSGFNDGVIEKRYCRYFYIGVENVRERDDSFWAHLSPFPNTGNISCRWNRSWRTITNSNQGRSLIISQRPPSLYRWKHKHFCKSVNFCSFFEIAVFLCNPKYRWLNRDKEWWVGFSFEFWNLSLLYCYWHEILRCKPDDNPSYQSINHSTVTCQ